jgi:hypothetical protein
MDMNSELAAAERHLWEVRAMLVAAGLHQWATRLANAVDDLLELGDRCEDAFNQSDYKVREVN